MNGYKVVVYSIKDLPVDERGYEREDAKQIFEQRVESLDLVGLVAIVNGLSPSYRV